jgi:DNA-directed RNA polymerase specialized sigma24 family protein
VAADDQERHLRAILRASERVRAAEATLGQRREDYREAIAAAHSAGVSLAAIGRALGVTRQRVKRIIEGK